MNDPSRRQEITDIAALKLLAHPLRHRIEQELRRGPVNSTTLARALGVSTGLASYHLRELAKHGFVEEVPELAHGRERWWRHVPMDRRFPRWSEQSPEMRAVFDEMNRGFFLSDLEELNRFERERGELGAWADAFPFSRGSIRVNLDELLEFFEAYIALLYRYNRPEEDTPSDARTVLTRFFAIPASEPPATEEERRDEPGD
ncbi:ArsR/SmtB family transcription factor [Actinomadura sp. HBU206391]|uniref:ArsR/SmtB family transcription factor n=1 Tax=Actinomadura sp. HBU206391 TaxID=2731692 RepID=UPI0016506B16|nr:helix-turn-helix domain-containing protein [Actinomadura sp. HBU206391]MBC6462199.1 helix-turn-helix transcriptional regulator [Actinomadura sp. HBU206391]